MTSVAVQETKAPAETAGIPWYTWSCLGAILSGLVGGVWDISWHESIGRDSFWTAPHVLIYLSGVLAGLTCGYLILSTTFNRGSSLVPSSVEIWGFRGPLGAFLCVWGAVAMIASAPLDNWWHSAYGLDVKILSPPHVLLIFGFAAIRLGTVVLIAGQLNCATGELRRKLDTLLVFTFPFLLGMSVVAVQELTSRNLMHSAHFYLVICLVAPVWMAAVSRISGQRWVCTKMLAFYTVLHLAFLWILPLFPAEPKLGPVYQPVTHLVPPEFPLLLLVPAIAWDILRSRFRFHSKWVNAALGGAVFLATFLAVQWPFATFLMSAASRNWIFGTHYLPYFVPSTDDYVRNVFSAVPEQFWQTMGLALIASVLTTRLGLSWGEWLRRIRR